MSSASAIPPAAQQAAQSALDAAMASVNDLPESPTTNDDEGQELEVDAPAPTNGDRTVFEDPKSFNIKHPLYSSWTLWFDSPNTKGRSRGMPSTPSTAVPPTPSGTATGWMDDIKKVISLDSVEEFWGVHNNIMPPSDLGQKANYYLFKDGIIPAWEDAANKDGGKWSIQLPREKNKDKINQMWLNTMLAAIGETYDPALSEPSESSDDARPKSLITGVIVSARPTFYRISIWTRLAASPNAIPDPSPDLPASDQGQELMNRIEAIGTQFKTFVLGFPKDARLAGPMSTDVEFISHKDSERKPKAGKKWII